MVDPIKKIPSKLLAVAVAATVIVAGLLFQVIRLNSHLNSTTKITQGLRDEVETLRKENQTYQEKTQAEQSQLKNMITELDNLKQDKDLSAKRQEELKKLVDDAEKSLESQNKKIKELEGKLKESDEKMRRQSKTSAELEQQTKSAKSNPAVTAEYVKLVENEWLEATQKTQDMQRDLDRTLAELSGQNNEREKLRSDTASMHYNLAVILAEQRNFPAAIREYEKVLETRPNDADAHYNLAIIYDDFLKNNDKALEHYRQYIQIAPDSAEAPKVRQWLKDKEYNNVFKFKL